MFSFKTRLGGKAEFVSIEVAGRRALAVRRTETFYRPIESAYGRLTDDHVPVEMVSYHDLNQAEAFSFWLRAIWNVMTAPIKLVCQTVRWSGFVRHLCS